MTATASVSRPLRKLLAAGPAIFRDGNALITGDACPAELLPELEALCLPRISEADGKAVVALLKEHAGRVRYIVEREGSRRRRRRAHARPRRSPSTSRPRRSHIIERRFRSPSPSPARCANDSRRRASQDWLSIRTGAASGWSRSSAGQTPALSCSTSSSSAGTRSRRYGRSRSSPPTPPSTCVVSWTKRTSTPVAIVDVLRVAALTHGLVGQSVSLASVTRDILNIVLPKGLAVSDWGAEPLSRAQLLYSALDSVVTFLVHQAQEHELSRQGRQVRRLMGACVVPVCEMERAGIPLDRDRHQAQIAEWNIKLPQTPRRAQRRSERP